MEDVKISDRLRKGTFANGYGFAVNLLVQLANVPLMISSWGISLYGEWLILTAIPAYITLSNIGIGDATATEMCIRYAKGGKQGALELFKSSWKTITITSLLVFAVVLLISSVLPIKDIFEFSQISSRALFIIIIAYSIDIIIGIQGSILKGPFRCDGNYHLHALISNHTRFSQFVVGAILLGFGSGPVAFILSYLCIRVIGTAYMVFCIKKKSPWINLRKPVIRFDLIKQILNPSLGFLSYSLGNTFINQAVIIFVGIFLGPISVVVFSTARTLSRVSLKILNISTNAYIPEMSSAFGSGKTKILRGLNRNLGFICIWLCAGTTLFLLSFGEQIIYIWTSGTVQVGRSFFLAVLLETFVFSAWSYSSICLMAANKHLKAVIWYCVVSTICLIIIPVILPVFGLIAVPYVFIVGLTGVLAYAIHSMLLVTNDKLPGFVVSLFDYKNFLVKGKWGSV